MNTKFTLVEQMRMARDERERVVTEPYKYIIDKQYLIIKNLQDDLQRLSNFMANPIKNYLIDKFGYELKDKLRSIIIDAVSKKDKPVKVEITRNMIGFMDNQSLESYILRTYQTVNVPALSLKVSSRPTINDRVTVMSVHIPELNYSYNVPSK